MRSKHATEVYCWKYRIWVKKCPLEDSTSDACLVNCPLKTKEDSKR